MGGVGGVGGLLCGGESGGGGDGVCRLGVVVGLGYDGGGIPGGSGAGAGVVGQQGDEMTPVHIV